MSVCPCVWWVWQLWLHRCAFDWFACCHMKSWFDRIFQMKNAFISMLEIFSPAHSVPIYPTLTASFKNWKPKVNTALMHVIKKLLVLIFHVAFFFSLSLSLLLLKHGNHIAWTKVKKHLKWAAAHPHSKSLYSKRSKPAWYANHVAHSLCM